MRGNSQTLQMWIESERERERYAGNSLTLQMWIEVRHEGDTSSRCRGAPDETRPPGGRNATECHERCERWQRRERETEKRWSAGGETGDDPHR